MYELSRQQLISLFIGLGLAWGGAVTVFIIHYESVRAVAPSAGIVLAIPLIPTFMKVYFLGWKKKNLKNKRSFCSSCGFPMKEGLNFCEKCGNQKNI